MAGKYIAPGKLVGAASKSANAAVRRMLARIAQEVEALPRDVLREFVPVLKSAQMELEKDLVRWLHTVQDGGDRWTAHRYRVALRQLRETQRVIGSLYDSLRGALDTGNLQGAMLSNRMLSMEIARLSSAFGEDFPAVDFPTVQHVMDRNRWLLSRFDRASVRYTQNAKRALRRQFAIGVTRGETINEMAHRIMQLAPGPRGYYGIEGGAEKVASDMARGLFRGRFTDAERLVRTEMMNAYNAHHQRTLEETASKFPEMKKRWDASADRHCILCADVNGEIRNVDEPFSSGDMYPPLHPNCRCVATPWMSHWPEVKPLPPLDEPGARRRSHPGGPVVTRGGTAKETNRALEKRGKPTSP